MAISRDEATAIGRPRPSFSFALRTCAAATGGGAAMRTNHNATSSTGRSRHGHFYRPQCRSSTGGSSRCNKRRATPRIVQPGSSDSAKMNDSSKRRRGETSPLDEPASAQPSAARSKRGSDNRIGHCGGLGGLRHAETALIRAEIHYQSPRPPRSGSSHRAPAALPCPA